MNLLRLWNKAVSPLLLAWFTWLIYPAREHMPIRIRFLVDFLSERLKREGP